MCCSTIAKCTSYHPKQLRHRHIPTIPAWSSSTIYGGETNFIFACTKQNSAQPSGHCSGWEQWKGFHDQPPALETSLQVHTCNTHIWNHLYIYVCFQFCCKPKSSTRAQAQACIQLHMLMCFSQQIQITYMLSQIPPDNIASTCQLVIVLYLCKSHKSRFLEVAIYKLWPVHIMQIFNTAKTFMHPHTHAQDHHIFSNCKLQLHCKPLWRWRLWKVRWPFPNRFATHVAVHAWNRHCLFCNYLFLSTYGFTLIFAWWRWLFCDLQHAKHSPNISHTHETIRVMIQSRKQTEPLATKPCTLGPAGLCALSFISKAQKLIEHHFCNTPYKHKQPIQHPAQTICPD